MTTEPIKTIADRLQELEKAKRETEAHEKALADRANAYATNWQQYADAEKADLTVSTQGRIIRVVPADKVGGLIFELRDDDGFSRAGQRLDPKDAIDEFIKFVHRTP